MYNKIEYSCYHNISSYRELIYFFLKEDNYIIVKKLIINNRTHDEIKEKFILSLDVLSKNKILYNIYILSKMMTENIYKLYKTSRGYCVYNLKDYDGHYQSMYYEPSFFLKNPYIIIHKPVYNRRKLLDIQ